MLRARGPPAAAAAAPRPTASPPSSGSASMGPPAPHAQHAQQQQMAFAAAPAFTQATPGAATYRLSDPLWHEHFGVVVLGKLPSGSSCPAAAVLGDHARLSPRRGIVGGGPASRGRFMQCVPAVDLQQPAASSASSASNASSLARETRVVLSVCHAVTAALEAGEEGCRRVPAGMPGHDVCFNVYEALKAYLLLHQHSSATSHPAVFRLWLSLRFCLTSSPLLLSHQPPATARQDAANAAAAVGATSCGRHSLPPGVVAYLMSEPGQGRQSGFRHGLTAAGETVESSAVTAMLQLEVTGVSSLADAMAKALAMLAGVGEQLCSGSVLLRPELLPELPVQQLAARVFACSTKPSHRSSSSSSDNSSVQQQAQVHAAGLLAAGAAPAGGGALQQQPQPLQQQQPQQQQQQQQPPNLFEAGLVAYYRLVTCGRNGSGRGRDFVAWLLLEAAGCSSYFSLLSPQLLASVQAAHAELARDGVCHPGYESDKTLAQEHWARLTPQQRARSRADAAALGDALENFDKQLSAAAGQGVGRGGVPRYRTGSAALQGLLLAVLLPDTHHALPLRALQRRQARQRQPQQQQHGAVAAAAAAAAGAEDGGGQQQQSAASSSSYESYESFERLESLLREVAALTAGPDAAQQQQQQQQQPRTLREIAVELRAAEVRAAAQQQGDPGQPQRQAQSQQQLHNGLGTLMELLRELRQLYQPPAPASPAARTQAAAAVGASAAAADVAAGDAPARELRTQQLVADVRATLLDQLLVFWAARPSLDDLWRCCTGCRSFNQRVPLVNEAGVITGFEKRATLMAAATQQERRGQDMFAFLPRGARGSRSATPEQVLELNREGRQQHHANLLKTQQLRLDNGLPAFPAPNTEEVRGGDGSMHVVDKHTGERVSSEEAHHRSRQACANGGYATGMTPAALGPDGVATVRAAAAAAAAATAVGKPPLGAGKSGRLAAGTHIALVGKAKAKSSSTRMSVDRLAAGQSSGVNKPFRFPDPLLFPLGGGQAAAAKPPAQPLPAAAAGGAGAVPTAATAAAGGAPEQQQQQQHDWRAVIQAAAQAIEETGRKNWAEPTEVAREALQGLAQRCEPGSYDELGCAAGEDLKGVSHWRSTRSIQQQLKNAAAGKELQPPPKQPAAGARKRQRKAGQPSAAAAACSDGDPLPCPKRLKAVPAGVAAASGAAPAAAAAAAAGGGLLPPLLINSSNAAAGSSSSPSPALHTPSPRWLAGVQQGQASWDVGSSDEEAEEEEEEDEGAGARKRRLAAGQQQQGTGAQAGGDAKRRRLPPAAAVARPSGARTWEEEEL